MVFVRAGVLVLTVLPDVNFPVIDLLDHVIFDELVEVAGMLPDERKENAVGARGRDRMCLPSHRQERRKNRVSA